MPLTHTRVFRVRHYECDAYGHVNNANYLRYMQETAFDASAAAGWGMDRYASIGRHWLIRETDIEYLKPLTYGDSVELKTWIIDFRRVRSRRAYEFRHVQTGDIVARAATDWIFLDAATGRPASIPPQLMTDFFPEGPPEEAPAREKFLAPPPPPPGKFSMRRRVEWRDIDTMKHVNNATYLAYMDDCGVEVGEAFGWPLDRMMDEGFAIVARRHRIEYRQPAVLGDELEISTWVSGMRHTSATRHYTITRIEGGEQLALAHTQYVWLDLNTGRPIRVPGRLLEDFKDNIVQDQETPYKR